jgi:hypothetical protein
LLKDEFLRSVLELEVGGGGGSMRFVNISRLAALFSKYIHFSCALCPVFCIIVSLC